jgi:uncharacterized YkwD family protein
MKSISMKVVVVTIAASLVFGGGLVGMQSNKAFASDTGTSTGKNKEATNLSQVDLQNQAKITNEQNNAQKGNTNNGQTNNSNDTQKGNTNNDQVNNSNNAQNGNTHNAQMNNSNDAQNGNTHKAQMNNSNDVQKGNTHNAQMNNYNNAQTGNSNNAQTGTSNNTTFASQVINLVNQERAKAGLQALSSDSALTGMALEKAKDMYNSNYFDHNSPKYGSPFNMMNSFGIRYSYAGENIAKGQRSPQEVMNSWMNSAGHRQNILNPNFTKIGVAFFNGEWVQEFISN